MGNNTILNHSSMSDNGSSQRVTCDDVTFNFYMNFLVIGTLCICGIVGNTLSILVLRKDPNNKVAIFLLQSLAVADNLLLLVSLYVLSIWLGFIPYFNIHNWRDSANIYLTIIMDPVGAMVQTAMVWFTVLLAINRFIAVCKPFQAPKLCTLKRAKIQVAVVVIFSVCFNIPKFFQYDIVYNGTDVGAITIASSWIGPDTVFGIVYTNAMYTVLVMLLPLLLLIGLNTHLIRDMRASRQRASVVAGRHGMVAPSEENISIIMIIIIVVFIICQTPDRIYQILNLVLFDQTKCDIVKSRLQAVCNLLIIINSSTNFIIYYLCRKSFRIILKQRICAIPGFRFYYQDVMSGHVSSKPLAICSSTLDIHIEKNFCNGSTSQVASKPLLETTRIAESNL